MASCNLHSAATWLDLWECRGGGECSKLQRHNAHLTLLREDSHGFKQVAGLRTYEGARISQRGRRNVSLQAVVDAEPGHSTEKKEIDPGLVKPSGDMNAENESMESDKDGSSGIQGGDLTSEKKEAVEEEVIKVEKKGVLGQLLTAFAWIGAWPSLPVRMKITSKVSVPVAKDQNTGYLHAEYGHKERQWANFVGGLPKDDFDYVLDLLFDPRKGLGMNIVRYNIGGGADLKFDTNLRPFGDVPGFKPGPDSPYDWSADKRQRDVLFGARERGANIFEAFNNSPPCWMTLSGSVTGNWKKSQDNLNPKYYEAFADYLTEVVLQYKKWGLHFDTLAPFNEPCEGWWYIDRKKAAQEGCNFSVRAMDKVIPLVKKSLARKDLSTRLSAFDAWTTNTIPAFRGMSAESLAAIDQVNAHTYVLFVQREDDAKRTQVNRNILAGGKKLWMSEYGPLNWNGEESDVALAVGRHITLDINDLHPSAWCYWQALEGPGSLWGLLQTPLVYGTVPFAVDLKKQYYVLMHFSRWIRPGFKVYRNEGLRDFLVTAVNPSGSTVVVIMTNTSDNNKDVTYDLSEVAPGLIGTSVQAAPFRTSRTENHAELPVLNFEKPVLAIRSVAKSVTTLIVSAGSSDHVKFFKKEL